MYKICPINGRLNTRLFKFLLIMKLTTICLFVAVMQVSAFTYAQRITLKHDRVSISQVFDEIKKQTGYDVFYLPRVVDAGQTIEADFSQASIHEVMRACLSNQAVSYEINEKTIVIFKKEEPRVLNVKSLLSAIEVTGRVTDSLGNPLSGVTVSVKGTSLSATTDNWGSFVLTVPDESHILVFTSVGYETQEIRMGSARRFQIILVESIIELDEVSMISTGYQRIKPWQSTGSVAVLAEREYDSRINTTDFLMGLQNKIPGLLINNDIEFEENSLFQIRGISTINANKQPLIVIDGYPTELTLEAIDPNEIESVTVLKDAAAATIYGARSSNGVIIIDRKKAKAGKPQFNFRATTSMTPKEDYTRYRWDPNASEILTEWEKINSATVSGLFWSRMGTLQGGTLNYNPPTMVMYNWRASSNGISLEERDRQLAEMASHNNTADYGRLFLRNGLTQTYNGNVSGGTRDIRYYITANYSKRNATEIKNDNDQVRVSARTTMSLTRNFSMELTNDYQEARRNTAPVPNIRTLFPYERLQDEDGNALSTHHGSNANPYYNQMLMDIGLLDNRYYPLLEVEEIQGRVHSLNNRIMTNFRYLFGGGFDVNFGGVYEISRSDTRTIASKNSSIVRQYINRYAEANPEGGYFYNVPRGDFLRQTDGGISGYTLRAQLNYQKPFGTDHAVHVIAGTEVRGVINKSKSSAYFSYNDRTLFHQPVDYNFLRDFAPVYGRGNPSLSYPNLFGISYEENRFFSLYSNLLYAFQERYSVTGSMRIDQSNLFGTDPRYKYKPLWSVGAAWNIDREAFIEEVGWLDALKLRVAYGFNGNVAKNALPQVIAADGMNFLDLAESTPRLSILSYANSGLRWEQTENINTGLDYRIFRNIGGHIDYYVKKSTDVLATNQIDASKGGTSALINQASIRNSGVELGLHADWIRRPNLNWNTGLVFAHNDSKVLAVYNTDINLETSSSRTYITGSYSNYLEGYAVGAMFTYRYAGVDETGKGMVYDKDGNPKHFFTDDNGRDDILYSGSSIPTFNLGLSNRIDVGSFYLYGMIHYYGGFNTRLPVPSPMEIRPLEGAGNYWSAAGDELIPDVLPNPREASTRYLTFTDKYTVNGAYLTLGDVTAAYSFRRNQVVRTLGFTNVELRVQASNLFTVGFNAYNFSKAMGSYEKTYLTPTYTAGLYMNF